MKVTGGLIKICQVEKTWFGKEKESLNLLGSFSSSIDTITRIIRTFSDVVPKITISETENYVSKDGREMVLASAVFAQNELSDELKNKIFVGQFLHEMSHLRFTLPEKVGFYIKDSEICKNLVNILEDKRIEQRISSEFPGFNRFLVAARSYYSALTVLNAQKGLKALNSYNKVLMFFITIKTLYPKVLDLDSKFNLGINEVINTLSEEIRSKASKICEGDFTTLDKIDIEDRVYELYDLFELEDKEDEKNLFKNNSSELSKGESGDNDDSEPGSGAPGKVKEDEEETCSVSSMFKPDDSEMSPESLNKASHLVKNIITEVRRSLDFNISESKAEEKDSSMLTPLLKKENTMTTHFLKKDPAVCEEVARLDTCLDTSYKSLSSLFRVKIKTLGSIIDREKCYFEQSEGELDEDELASIAVSKDLFFESDFKQELGLEMIVLLDLSGSMSGTRIEQQKTLSIALADAFSRVKGLKAKFYGHTTKSSGDYLEVLNIIDFNGKDRLFKLNSQRAASNNLDGFAIDFVSKKFDKRAKSKLLVVISDGQPAATNYSGLDAIAHVRSKVLMLEKQEIQVLSVSLASSYNAAQGQMYNNIIPFCSFKQTVQDISKWINTQFSKYSKTINF